MSELGVPPDPDDVSADYLILPRPPSHEFRFRLRTLVLVMLAAALLLGGGRLLHWVQSRSSAAPRPLSVERR